MTRRTFPALAVLLMAAVACGGDDGATARPESTPPESTTPETSVAATAVATTEIPDLIDQLGVRFDSPDGDVTILFPGEPVSEQLPVELDDGEILLSDYHLYESATGAFVLSFTDFPADSDFSDLAAVLEGARDGAIENIGGTLESSQPITVDGRQGIDFIGSAPLGTSQLVYRSHVYIQGFRMYQVTSVAEVDTLADERGIEFIDSFEFTGDAP